MHMADALLSPAVGIFMMLVSAAMIVYSLYKLKQEGLDDKKIPMMAVMGAFVFAAQMINFTIPGTGSSGHICGGILLAAMLGPYAGLLVLAVVLIIQCLFFGDGGLLALGCNIFNLGIACLVFYPLIFKPIIKRGLTPVNVTIASLLAVVIALQVGAFSVVLETVVSGITELPFTEFVLLMQPIHLAIGIVEGIITAGVLLFVYSARPELIENASSGKTLGNVSIKKVGTVLLVAALLVGGGLSLFASSYPDGLEWSMEGVAGTTELEREGSIYEMAANILDVTAFMPDYGFKSDGEDGSALGTTTAGLVGSVIVLLIAAGIGYAVYSVSKKNNTGSKS